MNLKAKLIVSILIFLMALDNITSNKTKIIILKG